MIIAIDGPAASGKGTLARRLAAHYQLSHLDTGLLYRATARALMEADKPLDDEAAAVAAARGLAEIIAQRRTQIVDVPGFTTFFRGSVLGVPLLHQP